jgi:hypothetical protein
MKPQKKSKVKILSCVLISLKIRETKSKHGSEVSKAALPHIRPELPGCWRHPFTRAIHTLPYLPARHIFHDSGLLIQIFLPFLHKPVNQIDIT